MARIFLDKEDNPLLSAVTGFQQGRKLRDDELYRKAMMDLEAQKFAEGRYAKPTKNEYGLFGGFEDDVESMKKDLPIIGSRIPWARPMDETKPVPKFSGVPGASEAGTDDMTSLINKLQKMSGKQVKMEDMVAPTQRAPQSQPMAERPLLANPKEQKQAVDQTGAPVKLVGPAAQADKVVADESKAIQGVSPEGRPQTIIPASETTQEFKSDLNVTGAPPQSPAVEPLTQASREPSDFNPSRSYLTRLAEYSTTGQTKETQPQVAVGNLPVEWQRIVLRKGPNDPITPQEQAITIPADMIKAVVEQSYKPQAQSKAAIEFDAALSDAIGQIEAGDPLNTVTRKLTVARGGKLPKADMDELQKAKARYDANKRAEKIAGLRQENLEISRTEKAVEKQDKAVERYKKAIDDTGVMAALPFLQQIEKETGVVTGTSPSKSKLPGVGTNLARAVPFFGNELAMAIAKTYKGAGVSQALQGLLNAQIRTQSGQAVTKYEEGRNLVQQGMAAGGSEEDVARGIQLMVDGLREAQNSVNAAFPSEVVELYQSRGGFRGLNESLKGQRQEKKKDQKTTAYDQELQNARSLMQQYRAEVQQQMEAQSLGAAWASRKVNERKAQVDKFLKDKYGKGYSDGQNP